MADCNKTIGYRIAAARSKTDDSQADLAAALGVKREMVTYWENGTRPIKAETIIEIAKRYNVSADFLLGLSETEDVAFSFFAEQTGFSNMTVNTLLHLSSEGCPSLPSERMRVSFEQLLNSSEMEQVLMHLQAYLDIKTAMELNEDAPFDSDYYIKKDSEVSGESAGQFHVVSSELYAKTFQTMACSELTSAFEKIAKSAGGKWANYMPREKTTDEERQDWDRFYEWQAKKSKIHEQLWNEFVRGGVNDGKHEVDGN